MTYLNIIVASTIDLSDILSTFLLLNWNYKFQVYNFTSKDWFARTEAPIMNLERGSLAA